MLINQAIINFIIFFIASYGSIFNRREILIFLICVELMLLTVSMLSIVCSIYLDDLVGQILSIFILTVAAAESAVGLGIVIQYFRIKGNISLTSVCSLRG